VKKLIAFIASLSLFLALAACSSNPSTSPESSSNENKIETSTVEKLTETSTVENIEPSLSQQEDWIFKYYVDEFNDETEDSYITYKTFINGKFSNSATTNSDLKVEIIADSFNDITITLYEYGRSKVKNSSSRNVDKYSITIKTSDGEKHNLTGTMYCGGDRIFIDDNYRKVVLDALSGSGTVGFYIANANYTTTTYLFDIPTSNFSIEYERVK